MGVLKIIVLNNLLICFCKDPTQRFSFSTFDFCVLSAEPCWWTTTKNWSVSACGTKGQANMSINRHAYVHNEFINISNTFNHQRRPSICRFRIDGSILLFLSWQSLLNWIESTVLPAERKMSPHRAYTATQNSNFTRKEKGMVPGDDWPDLPRYK